MNFYITANSETGAIQGYGYVAEPVPMAPVPGEPQAYFDPFEQIQVEPGYFKMKVSLGVTPNNEHFRVDVSQTPPVLVARPSLDELNTLAGADDWTTDGESVLSYGPALPEGIAFTVGCSNSDFGLPQPGEVTGGSLDLVTNVPGQYFITLDQFPWQTKTISVEARPA